MFVSTRPQGNMLITW